MESARRGLAWTVAGAAAIAVALWLGCSARPARRVVEIRERLRALGYVD